jgi:hypothetical protein
MRCKRKLPENVKAIPAVNSNGKKMDPRGVGDKRLGLQKTNDCLHKPPPLAHNNGRPELPPAKTAM